VVAAADAVEARTLGLDCLAEEFVWPELLVCAEVQVAHDALLPVCDWAKRG
jgi:hypothetical protein